MTMIRLLSKTWLLLLSLFMFYLSYRWIFDINAHLAMLGITVEGVHGINTLKSIMGSGLLMFALTPLLALYHDERWLAPLGLFMTLLLLVRLISLFVDGFHLKMGFYALLEALVVASVLALYKFNTERSSGSK
ncbi:hypothetical protein [Agarivorans sp. JK6]|uniref:hypothetical protein n=1 Tax=Agarivorans sp. JK6 TaxID=2997426 RepID=UPI003872AA17